MKEKIIISNGFHDICDTEATVKVDKYDLVIAGDGVKVGYRLYAIVDKKRYSIKYDGSDFYIEILGMTKEDWKKYNWDKLVK